MILTCVEIKKSYGIEDILLGVSFNLEEKEKAAVVGVNGAGKTTLFKIIAGSMARDEGEVVIAKGLTMGYLPQNSESESEKSLEEELLSVFAPIIKMETDMRAMEKEMGVLSGEALERLMERYSQLSHSFEERKGYEYRSRVRGVIKGLGFTEDEAKRSIQTFSGGQKTRVSLGKLLLTAPDIMLLDEPTNHLDIENIQWLEEFLRGYDGSVIIISHDRYFLDRIITKVIEIENKKSTIYNGNYSYYAKKKETDRQIALKQYLDQQKEIKRQEEVIRTLRSFNREKSIRRAESREKLLEKMERVERPESLPDTMRLVLTPRGETGNDVLTVDSISMGFGPELLFKNISFDIKKGDKTALIGPNGIGKTTLLKIITGILRPVSGHIVKGVGLRIGYYDQEQQNISPEKTIFQEIADTYPRLTIGEIRNVLAAFVFTGDDVFKQIKDLSGGERGRVALAKIMLGGSNFLILDEPTNHLDMFSKEILEDAIRNYAGTVLYISHDRYFINNTAQKILEMSKDGLAVYLGNYDYYMEKKNEAKRAEQTDGGMEILPVGYVTEQAMSGVRINVAPGGGQQSASSAVAAGKEDWLRKKENTSDERRRRSLIERLQREIKADEARLEEVDHSLTLPEVYTDHEAAQKVYDEKLALEERLLEFYEELEKASR